MKISKKRLIFERSILLSLAIVLVVTSVFSLVRPTTTEAAKPKYALSHTFEKTNLPAEFRNVRASNDGSVYVAVANTAVNGTVIEKYSASGTLVNSFNSNMRVSKITIGNDNSIYLAGQSEGNEVGVKYNQNGDIVARYISPNNGWYSVDISIGSDGRVYLLEGGRMEIFESDGTYIGSWSHNYGNGTTNAMAIIGQFIYMTNGFDIAKYQLDGIAINFSSSDYDIDYNTDYISEIAVTNSGDLLLSNVKSNELIEMTTSGSIIRRINIENWPDATLANNWSAGVDSSGGIYVSDYGMNIITKFSSTGLKSYDINRNVDGKLSYYGGSVGTDQIGNVYIADSGKFIQKFDKNGQFIKRFGGGEGLHFYLDPTDGKFSGLQNITVSANGDVYAYDSSRRQFQKFDSNGNFIARWGSQGAGDGQIQGDVSGMTVGTNGNLYVVDTGNKRIQVFSSQGQYVTQWDGGTGSGGEKTTPVAIASDSNGSIYTSEVTGSNAPPYFFRKYSSAGTLLKEWIKPDYSPSINLGERVYSIAVDATGNIYTYSDSSSGSINRYDSQGEYESQFKVDESGFYHQFVMGGDKTIIDSGANGVRQFNYDGETQEPSAVRDLSVSDATFNAAYVNWDAPLSDGGDPISGYEVHIKKDSNSTWEGINYISEDEDGTGYNINNLEADTDYDIRVRAVNDTGAGQYTTVSFKTSPLPPKKITSVDLVTDQNGKSMVINGTGLVGVKSTAEYAEALQRSLVTLNGTQLPFCTEGTGGPASLYIEIYGLSPDLVSDTPTCYQLLSTETGVLITPEKAIIRLSDDFDLTAQGTVSVNGSNTFTFNQQTTPGDGGELAEPTVIVNNKSLDGRPTTITKRPTFSGTAEPGARVTVTVRSDPIICSAIADSNGNWSCTLPSDLPAGNHTVTVNVTNPDGSTEQLGPYAVLVPGGQTAVTVSNTTPLAPSTGFERMATATASGAFLAIGAIISGGALGVAGVRSLRAKRT